MQLVPTFIVDKLRSRPNLSKILENFSWLFFDNILRMGVGLLVGVWIARYLGPEQYGILSFATAFTVLFGAIATLGLKEIVVRDIVRDPDSSSEILGTAGLMQLIGGLLSYILILVVIAYLRPDDSLARSIVAILGSIMLLKASDIAVYWFESQVQSKYIVWVQSSFFVVFAIIKIVMLLNQATITAFVWALLAEALVVGIATFIIMSKRGSSIFKMSANLSRAKKLLKDSWPLMLSVIAISIYMKIDQIMLGQMFGDKAVGIYSAATRISEVWYFIPTAIVASVFPAILEAKKRSEEQYYARLQRLYDLMVVMSVAVALPMTFLSSPLVTLLFGEAYHAAGAVLAVHIWASVFVFLGVASQKWLLAENRQILSLQRTVLGAVANVALNLWLIPLYGAVGAALATVASHALAAWLFDLMQPSTRSTFVMKMKSMNPLRLQTIIRRNK